MEKGECGSNGPVAGPADVYASVSAEPKVATATASIGTEIVIGQDDDSHVTVRASPRDLGTIVPCGDFD